MNTYFFGDSITFGVGSTDNSNRWTSVLSKLLGVTEQNRGISGSTLTASPFLHGFIDRKPDYPFYDGGYLFFAYGTNDCGIYGSDANLDYKIDTSLYNAILWLKNHKGWPLNRIICINNYYFTSPECWEKYGVPADGSDVIYQDVVDTINTRCIEFDIKTISVRNRMIEQGGDSLVEDYLHPNNDGHRVIAWEIFYQLTGVNLFE